MAYNPRTDLLRPDVQLETQGLAPGIAAAGQAFADTFRTYGQNLRQDVLHQQLREEQLADYDMQRKDRIADRDAGWEHELKTYGMKRQDMLADRAVLREQDLADYGMKRADARADKDEERQRELEDKIAHYGTTAGMYASQGFADPEAIAWAATRPAKEQAAAYEAIVGQASYKAQQALKQQLNSQLTPIPQGDAYQMTGNGQLVPPRKAANTLTPEMMLKFGLVPQQVTQGGVVYKAPTPPKPARPIKMKEGETLVDPATGRPVSTAPKTAQSYYTP